MPLQYAVIGIYFEKVLFCQLLSHGTILEIIEMTLTELHDLQSRLMLIAGEADKGKDDVTRFIDVLSSAENLAKAYVLLKLSGCLLFNDWFARIRYTEFYLN